MPHRKKIVHGKPVVEWRASKIYPVHYCEEFPLNKLRYKDLWAVDEAGRPWRAALRDDIKERGMRTPLIVWNHHLEDPMLRHMSKKPYILMNGRNRMWALIDLGYTHAPAIVSGECEYPSIELANADELRRYWPDGTLIVTDKGLEVSGKTVPTKYIYPK